MALVRQEKRAAGGNRDVPRNKRNQPLIVPRAAWESGEDITDMKLVPYTRMTTYIDCLEDKTNLARWGKRMLLVGLQRLRPGELEALLTEVAKLDEEGDKKRLNAIAERLHARAGGNDKADRGSWLHDVSEYVDRGEPLPANASDDDILDMAAYKLATIDLQVKRIESFVVLDEFKVGGTPDRVSWYDGPDPDGLEPAGHLITDLKTGSTEYGGLKMSMQLGGYSRSELYDPMSGDRSALPDDLNLKWGLIINLPAGSATCEVMWVDLSLGWEGFLLAKEVRAIRNRGRKAFRPYPSPSLASVPTPDDDEEDGEE